VYAPVVFVFYEMALASDRRITTRQTSETRNAGGFGGGLQQNEQVYHLVRSFLSK
jgi:hypothetical protein